MRLLLFDIDGTLLRTDGAGRPAVEAALSDLVGRSVSAEGVSFSGKTDPQILREVLTRADADAAWLDGRFAEAVERFQSEMGQRLREARVTALPGVLDLLARLADDARFQLGLLTGNLRPMAYQKVGAIGLGEADFPFGAFGSDAEDRNALPAVAAERAEAFAGRPFAPDEVVVVGDTPLDVACARHHGCRAVAVATGRYDRAALAEHAPNALLDDLSDADTFLDAVA